jgi:hypothetical protein
MSVSFERHRQYRTSTSTANHAVDAGPSRIPRTRRPRRTDGQKLGVSNSSIRQTTNEPSIITPMTNMITCSSAPHRRIDPDERQMRPAACGLQSPGGKRDQACG